MKETYSISETLSCHSNAEVLFHSFMIYSIKEVILKYLQMLGC